MSSPRPNNFFTLPKELRLEVYRHRLTTTLSSGLATEIGALYKTCKTISTELSTLLPPILPLLATKHAWAIHNPSAIDIPSFTLPQDYTYLNPLTSLTAWIPCDTNEPPHGLRGAPYQILLSILRISVKTLDVHLLYEGGYVVAHNPCILGTAASTYATEDRVLRLSGRNSPFYGLVASADRPLAQFDRVVFYRTQVNTETEGRLFRGIAHLRRVCGKKLFWAVWGVEEVGESGVSRVFGVDYKAGLPELREDVTVMYSEGEGRG